MDEVLNALSRTISFKDSRILALGPGRVEMQ